MRTLLTATLLASVLAIGSGAAGAADAPGAAAAAGHKHKVVFQVSDGSAEKWNLALNNIRNLQKDLGRENLDIELVSYGPGVALLKKESEVGARIQEAVGSGVKVVACQNTMRGMNLSKEDMLPAVGYVPSGVVEVVTKQEAGYAYVRP